MPFQFYVAIEMIELKRGRELFVSVSEDRKCGKLSKYSNKGRCCCWVDCHVLRHFIFLLDNKAVQDFIICVPVKINEMDSRNYNVLIILINFEVSDTRNFERAPGAIESKNRARIS